MPPETAILTKTPNGVEAAYDYVTDVLFVRANVGAAWIILTREMRDDVGMRA